MGSGRAKLPRLFHLLTQMVPTTLGRPDVLAPINAASLWNRNPFWPARFDSAVRPACHDVVAKATFGIRAFLCDNHLVGRKKGHADFATLRLAGNKRRDVAVDGRFADCFANVRITIARHPLAVE